MKDGDRLVIQADMAQLEALAKEAEKKARELRLAIVLERPL